MLDKCFYCRLCDEACPVDIDLYKLVESYHELAGIEKKGSLLWNFIYSLMLGDSPFRKGIYRVVSRLQRMGEPVNWLIRKLPLIPEALKTYFAMPVFAKEPYGPGTTSHKLETDQSFTLISKEPQNGRTPLPRLIRFKGCMDGLARPEASSSMDQFFTEELNISFFDLDKNLCCGFPHHVEGLKGPEYKTKRSSLLEIVRCLLFIVRNGETVQPVKLFSNCPTCQESLRDIATLAGEDPETARYLEERLSPEEWERFQQLFGPTGRSSVFEVVDSTEVALEHIRQSGYTPQQKSKDAIALKVPCHNTNSATDSQMELLNLFFDEVYRADNCCGLSGNARLKHPFIGTEIAEGVFKELEDKPVTQIVSGCPSCRDGVEMQRTLRKDRAPDTTPQRKTSDVFSLILQAMR